jgi:HlyD family secretion protein
VKNTVKWSLFAVSTLLLLGGSAGLLRLGTRPARDAGVDERRVTPVTAVTLAGRDFSLRGEYAARLEAVSDVTVTARVPGTIEEEFIGEGDEVEEGQPLYRLDDNATRFAMDQAEAALDLARENLHKAENFSRPQLIRRLESIAAQRESALKKAESDALRFAELYREGAVPLSQKENADLALASALSALEIARENLSEATAGARTEDRAAAEAAVRQAEAAWRLARDTWEKTVVRSPLKGTVALKKAFAGDTVQPGHPLAEIVDLTAFRVEFGVSAADVGFFRAGDSVTVLAPPDGRPATAVVKSAGVKADGGTGSFPIILEMVNPEESGANRLFRAGMDVSVVFTKIELSKVLVVPSSSLLREVEKTWVFVVDGKTARRRAVTIGPDAGGEAVVTAGLEEGEVLVIVGQQRLRDGDEVELSFEE